MLKLLKVHHIAIICSDYQRSRDFYTKVVGLKVVREHYRKERDSYKLDLALNDQYVIELFSFPHPPERRSNPEQAGLRHLAFETGDLNGAIEFLRANGVDAEPVRTDELTGKRFTFFRDPDNLPLELYER
jgi:glyoxylase I family protein